MKTAIAILAMSAAMAGAQEPVPAQPDVKFSPEAIEGCKKEGGCAVVTRVRLDQELQKAFAAGAAAGMAAVKESMACLRGSI